MALMLTVGGPKVDLPQELAKLTELRFQPMATELLSEFKNPRLHPLMLRYQGMGYYDLVCERTDTDQKDERKDVRYLTFLYGGSNGYDYQNGVERYNALGGNEADFMTVDQLYEKLSSSDLNP